MYAEAISIQLGHGFMRYRRGKGNWGPGLVKDYEMFSMSNQKGRLYSISNGKPSEKF